MKPTEAEHPDSPFAGFGPRPVRCRWFTADDERRAPAAEVVRLVVNENRWSQNWPNHVYQRNVVRQVLAFLHPSRGVVVTPAGMVTVPGHQQPAGVGPAVADLRERLATLVSGSTGEVLLGVDGCLAGVATPLQTIFHLRDGVPASHPAVKLYPSPGGESGSLLGWAACCHAAGVPEELVPGRRVRTHVGDFLALVCFDAGVFSGRSRALTTDPVRLAVRSHFVREAGGDTPVDYVLIATHHQMGASGKSFQNAASHLAESTGATVVTTMFAPRDELDLVATRFRVLGPRADRVVTLLVEDTLGEEGLTSSTASG
jgi:hypothetical protein